MTATLVKMAEKRVLHIADGLTLPLGAVTETFAILARKGAGKTYTGAVMTEEMVKAGLRVVVLDPLGAFWGLRAAANGKDEGLPVTILGGEHGDLPLESTAGRLVADLVVEHEGSFVLDLSAFESNAAQDRFVADFAERLYRAKTEDRRPLHLMIDEADAFAPQRPMPGQQRMLGAIEAIVRRGRIRGLGVTLITQRPAVLNKNVLTQAECLITLQMTAPQDRAAIDEWVRGNGTKEQRDQLVDSLASLQRGQAWFWSPAWLQIFTRVQVRKRETFDSSKTPEAGVDVVEPKRLAAVQIEEFKARMAETIERVKADDPKELRRQLAEKAREISKLRGESAGAAAAASLMPVMTEQEREVLANLERTLRESCEVMQATVDRLSVDVVRNVQNVLAQFQDAFQSEVQAHRASFTSQAGQAGVFALIDRVAAAARPSVIGSTGPAIIGAISHAMKGGGTAGRLASAAARLSRSAPVVASGEKLAGGERKILTALAQYPDGRTKVQVALLTGYAHNGGGFNNYISNMRSRGFVEGGGDQLRITSAGAAALGSYEPLPTGRALLEHWLRQLGKAERLILEALAAAYPKALSKEDAGAQTGYEPSGGGFNNALSRLRTLDLIEGRGELRASADLFG